MNYPDLIDIAYRQAQKSLKEGGVPVGAALFDANGKLLGAGHNQRYQLDDPSIHGETDAFRKAGRQKTYKDKILVTTLAPCWYCSGLIRQFNIGTVIVADDKNFTGGIEWLQETGTKVNVVNDQRCIHMMRTFIENQPELWHEDIGEDELDSYKLKKQK